MAADNPLLSEFDADLARYRSRQGGDNPLLAEFDADLDRYETKKRNTPIVDEVIRRPIPGAQTRPDPDFAPRRSAAPSTTEEGFNAFQANRQGKTKSQLAAEDDRRAKEAARIKEEIATEARKAQREALARGQKVDLVATPDSKLGEIGRQVQRSAGNLTSGLIHAASPLTRAVLPKSASDALARQSAVGRSVADMEIQGETTIDDLIRDPSLGNVASATGGLLAGSALDMAVLATGPAGVITSGVSRTGNIARQRADNNGRADISGGDVLAAAPFGAASAYLDKAGLHAIIKPVGKNIATRVAKAAFIEGGTEGAQSFLEYTGGTLGTDKGFDGGEALSQSLKGGLGGVLMGGAMRGGIEGGTGAYRLTQSRLRGQPQSAGVAEEMTAAAATPTQEDVDSPLPTDAIVLGRATAAAGQGAEMADTILKTAGIPKVGTKVQVDMGDGRTVTGTIADAFETDAGEAGKAQGVKISLDTGGVFEEHFDTLADAGVTITEAAPQVDEFDQMTAEADKIDADLAKMAAELPEVEAGTSIDPAEPVQALAPDALRSKFRAPVQGRITSGFGPRVAPKSGASTNHGGIDYGIPVGTPVGAVANGKVLAVFWDKKGGGNVVRVDHGGGIVSSYLHLDAATVKPGDTVAAGQPIARSGNSGNSTGPHLHLSLKVRGKAVDPRTLFGAEAAGVPSEAAPVEAAPQDNVPVEEQDAERAAPTVELPKTPEPVRERVTDVQNRGYPDVAERIAQINGASDEVANRLQYMPIEGPALQLLNQASEAMSLNLSAMDRVRIVAREIASIDGMDKVTRIHIAEALSYQPEMAQLKQPEQPPLSPSAPPTDADADVAAQDAAPDTTGQQQAEATAAQIAQSPPSPPFPTSTGSSVVSIDDRPGGKSIIVRGLTNSDADTARVKAALPDKAQPLWNVKEKGWVVSKKHEAKVRAALLAAQAGEAGLPTNPIAGEQIDREWTAFTDDSGTLGVPRKDMPQIKAEHRGAMVNFLNARGIDHQEVTVPASTLKPTQAEFSSAKVAKAKAFEGGNRAILVSSDGHVLDGHHQWMAARESGEDVRVIRLNAPIRDLLQVVPEMPSATTAGGSVDLVYVSKAGTQVKNLVPGRPLDDTPSTQDSAPDIKAASPSEASSPDVPDLTPGKSSSGAASDTDPAKAAPAFSADYGTQNKVFTADAAEKARALIRSKMNQLNSGFDPELANAGLTLMGYHIEAGARSFIDAATAIAKDLGVAPADLKNNLRSWYMSARMWMEDNDMDVRGMDDDAAVRVDMGRVDQWGSKPQNGEVSNVTNGEVSNAPATTQEAIRDHLVQGGAFATITEARKFIAERTGQKIEAGTVEAKRADEDIEAGVVMAARAITEKKMPPLETYRAMVDLYKRQPSLNVRTSTSLEQQAYSTPMPLAYLASQRAGIAKSSAVYEPSAGNGALLMEANPAKTYANELNPDRASALGTIMPGAQITENDATTYTPPKKVDVVIANPPFGPIKDERGENVVFDLGGGYQTREIDHAIAIRALDSMKDDGGAVLIVGGLNKMITSDDARSDAYNGKAKREFYLRLYSEYNVTDHFTVAGELYAKQGAGWPVDVIVIDGRGKSELRVPAADVPRQYASWAALEDTLDGRPATAIAPVRSAVSDPVQQGAGQGSGGTGSNRVGDQQRTDTGGRTDQNGDSAAVVDGPVQRESVGARPVQPVGGNDAATSERADPDATARTPARPKVKADVDSGLQVAYKPTSTSAALDTLVPVNMQTATGTALAALEARVGNIDSYVAGQLGFTKDKLHKALAAEQVDAVALALDNMARGAGFILGDQTGIGKGRVVAAIIRFAIKEGRRPIFVTEKPNLYADMYRDMGDVGLPEMLGRPVKILMTNAGETVPLDDTGDAVLKTPAAAKHNAHLQDVARGGGDYDVVFTAYSQMQSFRGEETERQTVLRAMAPGSILIFDESHNAGGQGAAKKSKKLKKGDDGDERVSAPNRAEFARELASLAHGVTYSSATYAKRPDVMDLYATTDMKYAVADPAALGDAIAKGGVPMQQVVASNLAEAGQYIRRERSFDGVTYDTPIVPVDRESYSRFTIALQAIQSFSEKYVATAVKGMDRDLKADGRSISGDNSTGGAGVESTSFTAIMHNLIDQMLLSIKAGAAADRAIKALSEGKRPVITVANTMASFLEEFASENGIKPGDPVALDFRNLLDRYVERTRIITMRKPFSKEKGERHRLKDSELGEAGVASFNEAKKIIASLDIGHLPISPIDHIRSRVKAAGYTAGEITGRSAILEYSPTGAAIFRRRPEGERNISGRRKAISGFNGGTVDLMILNQAGSTGLSLHASATFKNKNPRHMIIAQAEKNIDVHMQMLGRIHRSGQVVLPSYDQLTADVPAEKRPTAILAKKMASLNANTTGSRDSAMTSSDVPDFMNKYGDEVMARLMEEDPELHDMLAAPLKEADNGDGFQQEDAARKVTGRVVLLPLDQQEAFYDRFLMEYQDYIAQKEAAGESALEAKTLPLDAETMNRNQVIGQTQPGTPFGDGVYVETVSAKRMGKPFTPAQVVDQLGSFLETTADGEPTQSLATLREVGRVWANKFVADKAAAFEDYRRGIEDNIEDGDRLAKARAKLTENVYRFRSLATIVRPGATVRVASEGGIVYGIVTGIEQKGEARNPLALGTFRATIALADSSRQMVAPFSQLSAHDSMPGMEIRAAERIGNMPVLDAFSSMQTESRETRTIVTGNILAGFDHVKGKGQIINFTTKEGDLRQGILMARDYDYEKQQASLDVSFRTAEQVVQWVESGRQAKALGLTVSLSGGRVLVDTATSKSVGGRYFLDRGVRNAMDGDFVKSGTSMRATAAQGELRSIIDALRSAGAVFVAQTDLEAARAILGTDVKESRPSAFLPSDATASTGDTASVTADLRARMVALGIEGHIALRVVDKIAELPGAGGSFANAQTLQGDKMLSGLITVAMGVNADTMFTLNHESIHAMKALGLFRAAEWQALTRRAAGDADLMASVKRRYPALSVSAQTEEAIADMFGLWAKARAEKGLIGKAFDRILSFISALGSWARGTGFQSAESVMRAADRGDVAARPARVTATSEMRYSIPGIFNRDMQAEQDIAEAEARALPLVAAFGSEDPSTAAGGSLFDRWRTTLQDKMLPLLRTQMAIEARTGRPLKESENPYLGEELMTGKVGSQIERLVDDMIEPLFAAIKAEGVTVAELEEYLYARHAPERNARIAEINPEFADGGGSGMTDEEAAEIIDLAERSEKKDALDRLAAKVDEINKFSVQTRVESGLLSTGEARAWREHYANYVPLRGRGDIDENNNVRPVRQSGITVKGKESKRAFGRKSKAADILAYTIMQAEEAIVRAERNSVARQFLELAQANRNDGFWKVNKMERRAYFDEAKGKVVYRKESRISAEDEPFTISAKVDGREYRVTMDRDNPAAVRVADSMRNLSSQQLSQFAKFFGVFTRFFSRINTTLNPEFIVTNALRDLQTGSVQLLQHNKKGLISAVLRDWRHALTAPKAGEGEWADWRREFEGAGGKMYFADMGDLDTQRKRIEELSKSTGSLNLKIAAVRGLEIVNKVNNRIENAIRLSTYANARRMGVSKAQAASLARNVTVNFTRRGTAGPFINSFYAFFNAGVQGSTTLIRAAARSRKVRAALVGIVASGFLMDMMNRMIGDDDDDGESFWSKVPAHEKAKNFIIMLPGKGDKTIKIPIGLGIHAFYGLGRNLSEMMHGRDPLEAGGEAFKTALDAFNPLASGSLLTTILPTIVDPVAEIAMNENFAGKPIQPEPKPYGEREPASERYFGSVSSASKTVAKWLNSITGGDEIVEGAVSVSPEVLDYTASFFTGGVGRFIGTLGNLAASPFDPEREISTADIPFARKVVGAKPDWYDKAMFYERADKVTQTVAHAKSYLDADAQDMFMNYVNKNTSLLTLEKLTKDAKKEMSTIRKARNANQIAYDKGQIDRAAFIAEQDAIKRAEATVVLIYNTEWNAAMKPPSR